MLVYANMTKVVYLREYDYVSMVTVSIDDEEIVGLIIIRE